MKKAVVFFLALAALLSGCGGVARMPASEPVSGSFAYITGKYGVGFQDMTFMRAGDPNDPNQIRLTSDADYPLYKVLPGRYIATSTSDGAGVLRGRMAECNAEAGKITYIGDILLHAAYLSPAPFAVQLGRQGPGALKVRTSLTVTDNSEQVKAAIRKNYPGLAGDLDSLFVYRPAEPAR